MWSRLLLKSTLVLLQKIKNIKNREKLKKVPLEMDCLTSQIGNYSISESNQDI